MIGQASGQTSTMPPQVPHHPHAAEDREQLDERRQLSSITWKAAALGVGVVAVDAGADHQLALVGLADVDMDRVRHDDACRSTGFIGSETSACSGWLWIGRRTPAIAASTRVVAGGDDADLARPDEAARGLDARHAAAARGESPVTSQFWMMSTPRASAARAKPQATASCRATPPRRCNVAPSTG